MTLEGHYGDIFVKKSKSPFVSVSLLIVKYSEVPVRDGRDVINQCDMFSFLKASQTTSPTFNFRLFSLARDP